jgi:hypothetical protein
VLVKLASAHSRTELSFCLNTKCCIDRSKKNNLYLVTRPGRITSETHYLRQIIYFCSFFVLVLIGKRTTITRRQTVAIKWSFRFLGVLVQFAIRYTFSCQLFGCNLSQFLNTIQRWRIQRGDIVPCIRKLDTRWRREVSRFTLAEKSPVPIG